MAKRHEPFRSAGDAPRHELSLIFAESHPDDTARVLDRLHAEEAAAFLRLAPARIGAPVLRRMLSVAAARCLELLDDERAAGLLRAVNAQSATAILRHLAVAHRDRLVERLPTPSALAFRLALGYPEDAVGAWINARALALPADTPVTAALEHVRQSPEADSHLFVVDPAQRLLGAVTLVNALRATRGATLGRIMHAPPTVLSARASLRVVRDRVDWTGHPVLPVADHGGRFIGALEFAVLCRALERSRALPHAPPDGDSAALARGAWTLFAGLLQATVRLLPAHDDSETK